MARALLHPVPSQVSPHGGRALVFEVAHANEADRRRNALRAPALPKQTGWASPFPPAPKTPSGERDPGNPPGCRGLLVVRGLTFR